MNMVLKQVNDFRVKIDDIRKRIDVEVNCRNAVSEAAAKEVGCHSLKGEVAINQVSATSRIHIPEDAAFTAVTKGNGTSISYEKDGRQTERFDTPDAENIIQLNGIKSELVICTDRERS